MPNFRGTFGHRNTTIGLAVALVPTAILDWKNLAIAVGCLTGLFITPDWDLNDNAMGLIGRIGFVDEYNALVPHRHKISHTIFFSTIVRFLLTWTVPYVIIGAVSRWWIPLWFMWRFFVGLVAADALHIILDTAFTCVKRYFGRHRRQKGRKRRGKRNGRR